MNYDKLLLDELRLVPFTKAAADAVLTDELLTKAVTLNENLQTLGYVLSPEDTIAIAASPSLNGFYENIRGMTDRVNAAPMYPGFPEQVMELDEAVFRFHQMVHYFSTYGMERLFGVQVKKGWLPCETACETACKTTCETACETESDAAEKEDQKIVLKVRTIRLLPDKDRYLIPLQIILARRERMTLPEREIVSKAICHVSPEQLAGMKVGFKENLNAVYEILFRMEDRAAAFRMLRTLCRHAGDVLRCADYLLGKHRYHFRTSQKRFLVKLLESYPEKDFRANLVLSGKGAERNILLLSYLDYSVYSRSAGHMDAVNDLRDGRLRSFESIAKSMLKAERTETGKAENGKEKDGEEEDGANDALDFIAQRPGMMLRMTAWLLRLGYSRKEILERLSAKASQLSMQTLVTVMNHFGKLTPEERADAEILYETFESLLSEKMTGCDTPLRGKKVFLKMEDYDLGLSEIRCSDKSAEGGYIRSGIAFRIPEKIKRLRFFVYWNDKPRVDVDLHAGFTTLSGECSMVGWNQDFRKSGIVFSGDITHSDAAEYIDIDLTAPIDRVSANIHLYSGRPDFSAVETCYVGMMAVPEEIRKGNNKQTGRNGHGEQDGHISHDTRLYSEANCFFKHHLRQKCALIQYGYIDVRNRCLIFDGAPGDWGCSWYEGLEHRQGKLSLRKYLELLVKAQGAVFCDSEEDAQAVLVMGKAEKENEISLIDSNFFMA